MARAVWKGPFVEESLMKKVDKYKDDPKKIPIKTWSRKSTILPDFVGVSFQIYNGKKFIPITCLLYTSPSPRDRTRSRMPSSA